MRPAFGLFCLALIATSPVAVAQQAPAPVAGSVSGSVIDATSGTPLGHATVTLSSDDGLGVLSSSPSFALARSTVTTLDGRYAFTALAIGAYHLYVQRVGYAPAGVDIRLGEAGTSPVSVGLVVVPVRLRAVEIRATDTTAPGAPHLGKMSEDDRLTAARARQHDFLSSDARELTSADIVEGATLGGSDVFRALQRLPGVTQLDDWSAKLWVRGNRWDQSRVYYDGLPLFDPLQVLGRGAGVSTDAIGGAFLHPGVRPVSLGGEGAARIDLRSRPAAGAGDWRGSTELSLFGLGAAVEHEATDQEGGFVVSARHSLGDWWHGADYYGLSNSGVSDAQVAARGDVRVAGGGRLETSGLFTRDGSGVRGARLPEMQSWGNAVGRVTLSQPVRTLLFSSTIAVTHFSSNLEDVIAEATESGSIPNPTFSPVMSSVDYVTLGGRLSAATASISGWSLGYDLVAQRSSFGGLSEHLFWGSTSLDRATRSDALSYASLWGDQRVMFGERLSVEGGVRVDAGGSGLSDARLAPTLQTRYALSDRTSISAGAGRSLQYVQSVDLPAVSQGRPAPGLWVTSGGDVPLMAIDNAMLGVEHWMTGAVLLAANTYVRRTTGGVIGDPTPGELVNRPLFVASGEHAQGVEASARKLAGRVTGLLAYSYGHATTSSRGFTFPSPSDRTHALDATSMVRLAGFRVGAGFAWTSGAPYTRTLFVDTHHPSRGAPDALRAPNYASLDVFTDYSRAIRRASLSVFAGMQNVAGRTNRTWYMLSGFCRIDQFEASDPSCPNKDWFEAPVRYQPSFGLRLWF